MRIRELPFTLELMDAAGRTRGNAGRSTGLHLSDIIRDLVITLGLKKTYEKRAPEAGFSEQAKSYMEMGFTFENLLESNWKLRHSAERPNYISQQEFELDGVFCTIDGLDCSGVLTLEEYKSTWRSMSRLASFERDFPDWLMQLQGYCKVTGAKVARLTIFFVNGDYKPPMPKIRQLEFSFDQRELDSNWNMLLRHAAGMKGQERRPDPPVPPWPVRKQPI